jgi:hypothetical protein
VPEGGVFAHPILAARRKNGTKFEQKERKGTKRLPWANAGRQGGGVGTGKRSKGAWFPCGIIIPVSFPNTHRAKVEFYPVFS